jgi:hypothetical protein
MNKLSKILCVLFLILSIPLIDGIIFRMQFTRAIEYMSKRQPSGPNSKLTKIELTNYDLGWFSSDADMTITYYIDKSHDSLESAPVILHLKLHIPQGPSISDKYSWKITFASTGHAAPEFVTLLYELTKYFNISKIQTSYLCNSGNIKSYSINLVYENSDFSMNGRSYASWAVLSNEIITQIVGNGHDCSGQLNQSNN